MRRRDPRYWLRPGIALDGDVVWDVLESPFRPTPESLGPWADLAAAVATAEPDRVRVRVRLGQASEPVVAVG